MHFFFFCMCFCLVAFIEGQEWSRMIMNDLLGSGRTHHGRRMLHHVTLLVPCSNTSSRPKKSCHRTKPLSKDDLHLWGYGSIYILLFWRLWSDRRTKMGGPRVTNDSNAHSVYKYVYIYIYIYIYTYIYIYIAYTRTHTHWISIIWYDIVRYNII